MDGLALSAVPESGIEREDFHMQLRLRRFGYLVLRYPCFLLLFQERHHRAQLRAHLFDRLVAGFLAHRQEILAAGLILLDPFARELPGLNL